MTRLKAPVVLTIFNRIDDTRRVFETIRAARPKELFLIADGGRTPEEERQCRAARAVVEHIDWECTVHKNYSEKNMGAKARLATGISWVFEHVDRAIILEHDCLPHPDFFTFCEELLERYKEDERVMHISGDNFQQHNPSFNVQESYYFSVIPHVWGFATWARAWKHYDSELKLWPEAHAKHWLRNVFSDPAVGEYWEYRFEQYYRGEVESWDGQWVFACAINNGLSINPQINLVSNIGFGPDALSTKDPNSPFANIPTQSLAWPLTHPVAMISNRIADAYMFTHNFSINKTFAQRLRWMVRSRFPHLYRFLKRISV